MSESQTYSPPLIGAIDLGTSSTRFILFDAKGQEVCMHQVPLSSEFPEPGWVEQSPKEMLRTVNEAINGALEKLRTLTMVVDNQPRSSDVEITSIIKAVGITNQRETTIVWDSETSEPLHNAIGES